MQLGGRCLQSWALNLPPGLGENFLSLFELRRDGSPGVGGKRSPGGRFTSQRTEKRCRKTSEMPGTPPTPTPTKAAHITHELVGNTEPQFLPQTPRPRVRIRILTRSLRDLWINTTFDCLHQWVSPWLPAAVTRMLGPTHQQNR